MIRRRTLLVRSPLVVALVLAACQPVPKQPVDAEGDAAARGLHDAILEHHGGAEGELREEVGVVAARRLGRIFGEAMVRARLPGRFPAVRRDLSLLLASDVRFDRLRQVALNAERKLLREVDLFDVYEGDKLPAGKKSYALSFVLQDSEKTLTDEQVDWVIARIRQFFGR